MWSVGSSCLCKLMTSLFSVVSFHWFVLLAHWSPCAPLLNPSSSSPGPPPCLLIDTRADGVSSAGEKMCSLHPPVTTTAFMGVGSPVTRDRHRYVIFICDFLMFCKAGLHSASLYLYSDNKVILLYFLSRKCDHSNYLVSFISLPLLQN